MEQAQRAKTFLQLHKPNSPLILFNVWDSATAQAVAEQGAKAVATGSWSMAAAHGYADGQNIPLDLVVQIVSRIVSSVNVPVSVDFECGYSDGTKALAENFKKIIDTGAIGVNFEDQVIGENTLQTPSSQANRIEALAKTASKSGVNMFLNARTDLFLLEHDTALHGSLLEAAKERIAVYSEAGATGIFVPGLVDETLISDLCKSSSVPINVMATSALADTARLSKLCVSRISYGPYPYFNHIENFKLAAAAAYAR